MLSVAKCSDKRTATLGISAMRPVRPVPTFAGDPPHPDEASTAMLSVSRSAESGRVVLRLDICFTHWTGHVVCALSSPKSKSALMALSDEICGLQSGTSPWLKLVA